jgi:acyl carrier protein
LETQVRTIISDILKLAPEAVAGKSRKTLSGWDSLKHVEIMFALEESLDITFTEEQLSILDGVDKIIDSIQTKL